MSDYDFREVIDEEANDNDDKNITTNEPVIDINMNLDETTVDLDTVSGNPGSDSEVLKSDSSESESDSEILKSDSDNSNSVIESDYSTTDSHSSKSNCESKQDNDDDDYEAVCFMCHRPESRVEKMLKLPGGLYMCTDCMQRSLDTIDKSGFDPSMFGGFPGLNNSTPGNDSGVSGLNNLKNLNIPGLHFIDITDQISRLSNKQRPKKVKNSKKTGSPLGSIFADAGAASGEAKNGNGENKQVIDIRKIPAPHKIKAMLDEYVIGQEYAKKAISVAVYNHYKRVATNTMDEIEIEKSNMLLIGPSGCGKTYLVRTLARLLDVPLAITDATSLTEAGYIGDDIESVVSKLLAESDNDVEKAQRGIIFIDEIDKIAKKHNSNQRDVSGESVQQGMLKLLEGSEIEVPVGANSKNAMVPLVTVDTRNILFICGGAFPDLDEIIKTRLSKNAGIGFNSDLKDKFDKERNILQKVTVEDLRKFGMIPEFLGRLPVVCPLEGLTEDMLVEILKEPRNAILKQYQKLLELDEVKLDFTEEAYHAIAKKAMDKDTGARALRAVIEEFMLDIMYEIPKDDNIGKVTITAEYINGNGGPVIETRVAGYLPEPENQNSRIL